MKHMKYEWSGCFAVFAKSAKRMGRETKLRGIAVWLLAMGLAGAAVAGAQAVSTTTVEGTVYLANGQPGAGTLAISWPAFVTAAGQAVAADSTTVTIATDGFVSVNLAPNVGATPAGEYYTAVYYMSDGSTSTQYWVVPAAAQASLAQVQAQVMPAAQAVQAVSKAYVDQAITELSETLLMANGGTLSGPLYLSGDPTQPLQAADKHYVDVQVATAVPIAGGNMTGPLTAPEINGVEAPSPVSGQSTLQSAMSAAGTTGAMEIPPTYAGTDTFTNPNGVQVTDLRPGAAQQRERSVKEFGAVCDGVTDDTNALQAAISYANAHGVALTIPEGTCKTQALNWRGESIGGLGKQVSALMGFPGQDVLASGPDATNMLSYTRLHDLTIYVDQSVDASCSPAEGLAAAGSCQMSRAMEPNSIFSAGGNGLNGTAGTGAGGNGLKVAEMENVEIATTGVDPMAAEYPGAHSTHTCGMYLAQWPQWSEFRNIDVRGLNTGVAIPALPVTAPAGLNADSNRWQNVTIQATHAFTAAAGSNNVLDNVVAAAGNSAATGEPPTGLVLDLGGSSQGWTVRNAVVMPTWNAVQPALTVTAAGGAVTAVTVGAKQGLGWDPYGTSVPVAFSGSCTARATAAVNANGWIASVTVTQGGVGCSATTTASVNAAGTWDTAAAVNLIGGQNMTFFGGNLLKGNGGYTVWNAASSASYGTQLDGGGGTLPGGGTYAAMAGSSRVGPTFAVDQFPGADIGAKIQSCVNAVNAIYGGTCDARNFIGSLSMGSNLTISTGNTAVLLPCATIATANQIVVTAGTRNVALRGCALRGGTAASGSQGGTVFAYSGAGAMVEVGDPTYATDTPGFHMDNVAINTTAAASGAKGLVAYRTQELDLESLYFLGNSNQTGMTLDGTGNYTGGTILDNEISGFGTTVNAIGHQIANPATTDWMNASTFVRLHIDCPTSSGNPISGTYGINLQQGDGNTFTGGDVEGCATALHLGSNAQNNTMVGLRNENSTNQVVADAGSQYNSWITGGTMFTGQLTDNGTHNSFWDSFHRTFNNLNGDLWRSQADTTVTDRVYTGIGLGHVRGRQQEWQTDVPGSPGNYQEAWLWGPGDGTAGSQTWVLSDLINNTSRFYATELTSAGGNDQTGLNSAGTGSICLECSANAGTGGVTIASGGATPTTVATFDNTGDLSLYGQLGFYTSAGLQWYWSCSSTSVCELHNAGATTPANIFLGYPNGETEINSQTTNPVVINNTSTAGTGGFKVYEGGSNYNTELFGVTGTVASPAYYFPGLAPASGAYCLEINSNGYMTNTGAACGSGSGGTSGTINSGSSGQIAYYTANGTTIGGTSAVPLTAGGTGATSASGAIANLLPGVASDGNNGITVAKNITAGGNIAGNINGNCVVTAYGAKGDCTVSGPTNGTPACTDNHAAIQAAVNACYATGGSVYFPTNPSASGQTIYYTSLPIDPEGVSMYGDPGAGGQPPTYQVAVLGAPGQDVFNVPDPTSSSYVTPITSYSVRDLAILIDDTVDASSSHPHRLPGRSVYDAAMTSGSGVLTSATAEFQPGDVGQAAMVYGAGASAANLTTTIASWQSATQVTLAAAASTSVSGAHAYVSVMGLSATQTMGNCGYCYDSTDNTAEGSNDSVKSVFSNVVVDVISNDPGTVTNHSVGFMFQGNAYVYQDRWQDVYVGAPFTFAFIPADTQVSNQMNTGMGDYNIFDHVWLQGTYPFLAYDGIGNTMRDIQITSWGYNLQLLNAYGVEPWTYAWNIDIPESEVIGTCPSGITQFRIAGIFHHFGHLSTDVCAEDTMQWDASTSAIDHFMGMGNPSSINITGNQNAIHSDYQFAGVTVNSTGVGNTIEDNGFAYSYFNGVPTARARAGTSTASTLGPANIARPAKAFARTHDFIDKGAANYYPNGEDLWIWPYEVSAFGGTEPTVVAEPASDTGAAIAVSSTSLYLNTSNSVEWTIGTQFPAGKMRVYIKAKGSTGISSWTWGVGYGGSASNLCSAFSNLTTSYQVFSCDADGTSESGQSLTIGLNSVGSGTVYVAWIGVKPWDTDTDTTSLQITPSGTPMTGNHGTGAYVQHSDGTGTSGYCAEWAADGSLTNSSGPCGIGGGSGTVQAGSQYSPAFYSQSGSSATVGGVTPFTGLSYWSTSGPPAAATGAQIVSAIGSTAVANATAASTAVNFATPVAGVVMGNGSSAPTAATSAQIQSAIGSSVYSVAPSETYNSSASGSISLPSADHAEAAYVLSGNVTSTTIGAGVGGAKVTIIVCQPASGGPYTWTWPSNWKGGVTIGTTAGTCSLQVGTYVAGQSDWKGDAGATNLPQ